MRGLAARIAAATPAARDRTIDALRAVAILGVICGHWLVTALAGEPGAPLALHDHSPLSTLHGAAPLTWVLQMLGPFFFVGGYAAARGRPGRYRDFLSRRVVRLLRPVLVLAAVWAPALVLLISVGAPDATRHTVRQLVTSPLWFLGIFLALTAATPVARALVRRFGLLAALPPLLAVAGTDLMRPHGLPLWWELTATVLGWSVPYLVGIAFATGRLSGRLPGAALLAGGVGAGALLVGVAGYPASAVGVPGDNWSNLDPPSLFAMALAAAQLGAFLLLRPWLAGVLRRPAIWAPIAALNLVAMTVYCWHQTALLGVSLTGALAGAVPGLTTTPDGVGWLGYRALWMVVFAVLLAGLVGLFRRYERPGRRAGDGTRGGRPVPERTAGAVSSPPVAG